ncbi:hypothetical protein B484DRAFT_455880 [Ochromonadaceae sp. CCMP2298]|nr:hypothetical protein B484DRAFT_455880 [Ochromonadaceae sp. CCMP2298]|mmetsp:Transcript_15353/g.33868  ORF Transcript_15353/g.33868 Transcript_15353/m.33868 type:complete len:398 (-) Transcript_15353:129-1322(-)
MDRYRCDDCEEDVTVSASVLRVQPLCPVCGSLLVALPASSSAPNRAGAGVAGAMARERRDVDENDAAMHSILELVGVDLREAIQEAMQQQMPSRQISVSYLSTMGKVVVDERRVILRDTSLTIGPLHILAVPAAFSYLPDEAVIQTLQGQLVLGDPLCGESALRNASACRGCVVLLHRGEVSFAAKSRRAAEAGAKAVLIAQTEGVWPFVMTDSAGEGATEGALGGVPVLMISRKDADIVKQLVEERAWVGSSSGGGGGSVVSSSASATPGIPPMLAPATAPTAQAQTQTSALAPSSAPSVSTARAPVPLAGLQASLRFAACVTECSICQELFGVGDSVLKLPCRHLYHVDCVTSWLLQNHTCPLCRLELPKESGTSIPRGQGMPALSNGEDQPYFF